MKTWSSKEIHDLIRIAPDGMAALIRCLPTKSRQSIYSKASKLGVSISHVMPYDRMASEETVFPWLWENRILPRLEKGKSGCWEWRNHSHSKGYGQIRFFLNGKKTIASTHRISYYVANGSLPECLSVLHSCDNPPCNNPAHLFIGTPKDNTQDMHRKGRARGMFVKGQKPGPNQVRGRGVPHAKLTDDIVREAREIHARGEMGHKLLAKKYGVGAGIMRRALKYEGWKHVAPTISPENRHPPKAR